MKKQKKVITVNQFNTPESLKVLGIRLCPDCGSHMSIDNSVCYGCGFEDDDLFLHENNLNRKNGEVRPKDESLYLVFRHGNSYHKDPKKTYHLMINEITLCGVVSQKTNRFELVGKMNFSRIPTFYKSPCKRCLDKLENNHI